LDTARPLEYTNGLEKRRNGGIAGFMAQKIPERICP
jgi:hypothetical protein